MARGGSPRRRASAGALAPAPSLLLPSPPLLLLLLALLAAAAGRAAAAPTAVSSAARSAAASRLEGAAAAAAGTGRRGHGAYLGCFNATRLPGLVWSRKLISLTPESAFLCADHCRGLKLPLYALSRSLRCACTAQPPDAASRLADGVCEALPARGARVMPVAVPMFYLDDSDDQRRACSLVRAQLSSAAFEPAYNPQNARFNASGDAVALRLNGDHGTRLVGQEAQLFGMLSFRARASDAPGVITAAYLRSDKQDTGDKEFEEIDLIWLNGHPALEPGTVWLNTYRGGTSQGEYTVAPDGYAKITKSTLSGAMHTYAIDWQPSHVSWYLNGLLLKREPKSDKFTPPSKPLYLLASIWSDAARGFEFGGRLDYSKSPFFSAFASMSRVVCNGTSKLAPDGGLVNGPAWTYAKSSPGDARLLEATAPEPPTAPDGVAVVPAEGGVPVAPAEDAAGGAAKGAAAGGAANGAGAKGDGAKGAGAAGAPAAAKGAAADNGAGAGAGGAAKGAAAPAAAEGAPKGAAKGPKPFVAYEEVDGPLQYGEGWDPEVPDSDVEAEPPAAGAAAAAEPAPAAGSSAGGSDAGDAFAGLDANVPDVDDPPPADAAPAAGDEEEAKAEEAAPPAAAAPAPAPAPAPGRALSDGGAAEPAPLAAQLELPAPAAPAPDAAAEAAPRGVYLGCFDGGVLQLSFEEGSQLVASSVATCTDHCRGLAAPAYALDRSYRCLCLADAPHPAAKLPDAACASSAPAGASVTAVPIYYIHSRAGEACEVLHARAGWDAFEAVGGRGNARPDGGADTLSLQLRGGGPSGGARVASRDAQTYGLLSFKARASDAPGVVTAVNLRSDKREPGSDAFDEISFQFVNGRPAAAPGSLLLSAAAGAARQGQGLFAPEEYSDLLGRDTTSASEYHAYTVDWQPDHVAWYMDGALLMRKGREEGFSPPDEPLYLVASVWTDAGRASPFGGKLDASGAPYESVLSNVVRVSCAKGAPAPGPAWASGGTAPAAAEPAAAPEAGLRADPAGGTIVLQRPALVAFGGGRGHLGRAESGAAEVVLSKAKKVSFVQPPRPHGGEEAGSAQRGGSGAGPGSNSGGSGGGGGRKGDTEGAKRGGGSGTGGPLSGGSGSEITLSKATRVAFPGGRERSAAEAGPAAGTASGGGSGSQFTLAKATRVAFPGGRERSAAEAGPAAGTASGGGSGDGNRGNRGGGGGGVQELTLTRAKTVAFATPSAKRGAVPEAGRGGSAFGLLSGSSGAGDDGSGAAAETVLRKPAIVAFGSGGAARKRSSEPAEPSGDAFADATAEAALLEVPSGASNEPAAHPTQRKPGGLFGSLPKLPRPKPLELPKLPRLQAPHFPRLEAGAGKQLFGGFKRRGGVKVASLDGAEEPQVEVLGWEEAAAVDLAPGDADGGVWAL